MIRSFFIDKYEYDYASNLEWIRICQENEADLPEYVIKSYSHILNVHHRWLCVLTGNEPESGWNDIFDPSHWEALARDNYLQSIDYLEHSDFTGTVHYFSISGEPLEKDALDVLYHILNHSNYHRAQISVRLRDAGIQPPSFNFISYR